MIRRVILSSFSTVKIVSSKQIVKKSKKHTELTELKNELAKKQPKINPQLLYKEYHHREIYQKIDTNLQSFFHKRQYTLENFNFLIDLLAQQNKTQQIDSVIAKMNLLKIEPDARTYNYIVKAYGKQANIQKAEQYFQTACKIFQPNKYLYTTLMQAYLIKNDSMQSFKILQEMEEKGLIPDLPVYTTLINSFRRSRNLEKCWQINKKVLQTHQSLDQGYVGVILKVYAATHDAEKAIKIYKQHIMDKNIKPMIQTTNSYFKALSTRKEYANMVIDSFFKMFEKGELINNQTVRWALKACSTIGNIRSAGEILKVIKQRQFVVDKPIYNSLLRTYSKACLIQQLDERFREVILIDSWKLIEQIKKHNMLDTTIVNNLLQIYANSLMDEEIDGLVLPLFEKNNLSYNSYTFEILMGMYYKKNDLVKAMKVCQAMKKHHLQQKTKLKDNTAISINKEEVRPTFKSMDWMLNIAIKLMDMRQVLDTLDLFKQLKRTPKNQILKFLGNLPNLPEEIQVSLMDFDIQFGKVRMSKKGKNIEDPQNL